MIQLLRYSKKFNNLIVVTKNSDPFDVKEQLNNIFINIDKFDIEHLIKIIQLEAVTKKLNIL